MIWAPYHAFVRAQLRRGFAMISAGRGRDLADQFREDAYFRFAGDHAMGGDLRGRALIRAWFERMLRLFPNHSLTPLQMVVNGGPWDTTIATRFRVRAPLPNGELYENEGMQYVRIVWGAIVEDRLYEDTAHLERTLQALAQAGVAEASAPPLSARAAREHLGPDGQSAPQTAHSTPSAL